MNIQYVIRIFIILFLISSELYCDNINVADYNIYYDTRKTSDATINLFNKFNDNFNYFSFTNLSSSQNTSEQLSLYSEHNLRYKISEDLPIELTYQFVIASGDKNDKMQFGLRYKLNNIKIVDDVLKLIKLEYNINPMLASIYTYKKEEYLSQIEHVFKFNLSNIFYNGDLYIAGFIDQNLNNYKWVYEAQLGVNFYDNFYFVTEYRYNDFMPKKDGIGIGFEYKIESFSK